MRSLYFMIALVLYDMSIVIIFCINQTSKILLVGRTLFWQNNILALNCIKNAQNVIYIPT